MTTKPDSSLLGYTSIRISKKAHRELVKRALKERRPLVAQFDIEMGV